MTADLFDRALADLRRHEATNQGLTDQQRIDWINRRLVELGHDPREGIVAGDGCYYQRKGYPE